MKDLGALERTLIGSVGTASIEHSDVKRVPTPKGRTLLRLRLLSLAIVAGSFLCPRGAAAQEGVVVVAVAAQDPSQSPLDVAKLRTDIGADLGVEAVAPDDPRATQATGTLRISVDRATHSLTVAYESEPRRVERRVELPSDARVAERAAALLAGNLARDEAGDLASELRKGDRAKAVSPAAPSPEEGDALASYEHERERYALDRLGVTLAGHVQRDRWREQLAYFVLGGSLAAIGAGATVILAQGASSSANEAVSVPFLQTGFLGMLAGGLLLPGDFGELNDYYARERAASVPVAKARADVEQAWLRAAHNEHRRRRVVGWVQTVGGALLAGTSATILVIDRQQPSSSNDVTPLWAAFSVAGAATFGVGLYLLVSDGPLESAWREYEHGAPPAEKPTETASIGPVFAPASGGALVGIGGHF
jgi:hypothetical protein